MLRLYSSLGTSYQLLLLKEGRTVCISKNEWFNEWKPQIPQKNMIYIIIWCRVTRCLNKGLQNNTFSLAEWEKSRIVVVLPDDNINHLYIWLVWCFHTNQIIYFSDGFYGFSIFQDHNNLREAINYTCLNACAHGPVIELFKFKIVTIKILFCFLCDFCDGTVTFCVRNRSFIIYTVQGYVKIYIGDVGDV